MKTHWISTTLFCLAVAVIASTADAALVSVDFNAVNPDGLMNRDNTFGVFADDDPTYVWNQRFDAPGASTGALVDTDGVATTITATVAYYGAAQNWQPNDGVLNDGYHDNNGSVDPMTLTISGLTASTMYELVVFDSISYPTETQTVGGVNPTAFSNELPLATNYTDGVTYQYWKVSTGGGTTLSLVWLGTGPSYDTLTGFQIREAESAEPVIPEPATMCALGLAIAGLGGYVRKRRRA